MLDAVLFDLDGTLLDIDIEAFLGTYFAALSKTLAAVFDEENSLESAMQAVYDATGAMMRPHEDQTNSEVFHARFKQITGVSLREHSALIDRFYAEVFPTLGAGIGPAAGGRDAVLAARECGLSVAVATNPIFPRPAILHRMSWAGIAPEDVDLVTDYEMMRSTKPHPSYFRQTASLLGVEPERCLMVGDDRMLDLSAADVGMRTFHISTGSDSTATYCGTMADVAPLIRRLCEDERTALL